MDHALVGRLGELLLFDLGPLGGCLAVNVYCFLRLNMSDWKGQFAAWIFEHIDVYLWTVAFLCLPFT